MNTTLTLAVLFVWVLMMWRIGKLESEVEDLREEVRNGARSTEPEALTPLPETPESRPLPLP